MILYCVTRQGVYRHEIAGAWSSVSAACEAAVALAKLERDAYHTYDVNVLHCDTLPPIVPESIRQASRLGVPFEELGVIATIGRVIPGTISPYEQLAQWMRKANQYPMFPSIYVRNHQTESISYVQL